MGVLFVRFRKVFVYAPDGTVYGIELLNANVQLGGKFQIEANKDIVVTLKVASEEIDLIDLEETQDLDNTSALKLVL